MLFATSAVPWGQYSLSHAVCLGRTIKKYLTPSFIKYGKAAGSITFIATYPTSVAVSFFILFFTRYTLLWKLQSEGRNDCQCVLGCGMFPLTATFFSLMSHLCVTCGHYCCTVTSGQKCFFCPTRDAFQLPCCLWLTELIVGVVVGDYCSAVIDSWFSFEFNFFLFYTCELNRFTLVCNSYLSLQDLKSSPRHFSTSVNLYGAKH